MFVWLYVDGKIHQSEKQKRHKKKFIAGPAIAIFISSFGFNTLDFILRQMPKGINFMF